MNISAELPPPLSLIAIVAIIMVYMVICYLVLDLIDQQGDSTDEISGMDDCAPGLSVKELQEIKCFYLKGEANLMCAICLDSFYEAELCRSFPACNHVFHAQCIDPWLAKRTTCPTCRTPFRRQLLFLKKALSHDVNDEYTILFNYCSYIKVDFNDETSRIDACGSGLSVEELQGISCFYHKGQANSMCAICLDGLYEAELCRSFPACDHVFHAQCIDPWLAEYPSCPTCRTPFRPQLQS